MKEHAAAERRKKEKREKQLRKKVKPTAVTSLESWSIEFYVYPLSLFKLIYGLLRLSFLTPRGSVHYVNSFGCLFPVQSLFFVGSPFFLSCIKYDLF